MTSVAWILAVAAALIALALLALVLFTAWPARQGEKQAPGPAPSAHSRACRPDAQLPPFAARPARRDFRVIILDRPGSGYSVRPDDTLAPLSAQARVISSFCQALALQRPVVVGHSLGGAIALALALEHPEQVGALALIAPVTHQPQHIPPPFDGLAIGYAVVRAA